MAAGDTETKTVFVLSVPVVRWAVQQLQARQIHTFFVAYLVIRRQAGRADSDTVQPDWSPLDIYLDVPGGPPSKPWFRPFWDQARNARQDWIKRHPAGSWNPSSVRPGTAGANVLKVGGDGKSWVLGDDHYTLAREHLLHGQQAPLVPLCVFLYRNFGFTTNGTSPHPIALTDIFREDFAYRPDSHDAEFEHLYDTGFPDRTDWFEPVVPQAEWE